MTAYFLLSYCFPMFGLLVAVLVLTRTNTQELAYSAARPVTLHRPYPPQVRPDANRQNMFRGRLN